MQIRLQAILSALAIALCLQGCGGPPEGMDVVDSSTADSSTEVPESTAPSEPAKPASTDSGDNKRKRTPVVMSGGAGGGSAQAAEAEEKPEPSKRKRTPVVMGLGSGSNKASQTETTQDTSSENSRSSVRSSGDDDSSDESTNDSSSSNSSGQSSRGRSGPPAGSNYGNSSSSANRGRSGPPPGSNYGNSGRPPGIVNPYESGSGSYGQSGSSSSSSSSSGSNSSTGNQERGNSGSSTLPPPTDPSSSGGNGSMGASLGAIGGPPPGANNNNNSGGSSRNGFGGNNAPAPAAVEETSFFNMAVNQYAAGNDLAGTKLLQAELIANRERFEEFPLSFWREAKRPTLGIRMGIGVNYVAVGDFSGKPPVLGDPAPEINRNRGGAPGGLRPPSSGGASGGGGNNSAPPAGAEGFLKYYSGDITDAILAQFESRFQGSPARFGAVLAGLDVRPVIDKDDLDTGSSQTSRKRTPAMMGAAGGSTSSGGFNRQQGPAYGFYPGLVFLGEGTMPELERKAEDEKLDGYIVIKQKAQTNRRTGQGSSETKAEFYLAGKKRGDTKTLYYQVVAGKRSQGEDPVEEEVTKLFEKKVDRFCTVIDFPSLTEEQCVGRLDSIEEESKTDPLPYLLEANFYVHKGWLNEDLAQEKIIALIGEDNALNVFSEDFEKQKSGLRKWLPK